MNQFYCKLNAAKLKKSNEIRTHALHHLCNVLQEENGKNEIDQDELKKSLNHIKSKQKISSQKTTLAK